MTGKSLRRTHEQRGLGGQSPTRQRIADVVIAVIMLAAGVVLGVSTPAAAADDGATFYTNGNFVAPLNYISLDEQNRSYGFGSDSQFALGNVWITSTTGSQLVPGVFDGSDAGGVRVLTSRYDECAERPDRIEILQAEYVDDNLVRFAARTQAPCGEDHVAFSLVAYHATVALPAAYAPRSAPTSGTSYPEHAAVGYSRSFVIPVVNIGTTVVHPTAALGSPSTAPPGITIDSGPCSAGIAPGARCELKVQWKPTIAGSWDKVPVHIASEFTSWATGFGSSGVFVELELVAEPEPPAGDGVHPITPQRVLDTRTALGVTTSTPLAQVPLNVRITGWAMVPDEATAILANVTVTEPSVAGYVSVYPGGDDRPTVSNVNFVAGETVANTSIIALGPDGSIDVFNGAGSAHVVIDVSGWLSPQEPLVYVPAVTPLRMVDTRAINTGTQTTASKPLGQGEARPFPYAAYRTNVEPAAVLVNVTATDATAPTYLTVFSTQGPGSSSATRPLASTLNVVPGNTRANVAMVDIDRGNTLVVYNNAGTTHVVIDILGIFVKATPGSTKGRIIAISPFRTSDTRETHDAFGPGEVSGYQFERHLGDLTVGGLIFNMTVANPTRPGYLTMFPGDAKEIPFASNVNFVAGQTVPNSVWVRLAPEPDNYSLIYAASSGTTDIVLDLQAIVLE